MDKAEAIGQSRWKHRIVGLFLQDFCSHLDLRVVIRIEPFRELLELSHHGASPITFPRTNRQINSRFEREVFWQKLSFQPKYQAVVVPERGADDHEFLKKVRATEESEGSEQSSIGVAYQRKITSFDSVLSPEPGN